MLAALVVGAFGGGPAAAHAFGGEDWDRCGPLTAPAQVLCLGEQHVWLRFLVLFATPGYGFTGTISVHLDHAVPFSWNCPFVNGYPSDYCWDEGVFPPIGVPFLVSCTADGVGIWGCSSNHA